MKKQIELDNEIIAEFVNAELSCRLKKDSKTLYEGGFFRCEYKKFNRETDEAGLFSHWKIEGITGEGGSQGLKFHENWNWLMFAIEKILELCFNDEEQETYDSEKFYEIRDHIPDINKTYQGVLNFIKNYNNGNKD